MKAQLLKSIHSNFENSLSLILAICESEIEKIFLLKVIDFAMKRPDRYSMGFILLPTWTEARGEMEATTSPVNYQMPDDFGYLCGVRIANLMSDTFFEIYPQKLEQFHDDGEYFRTIKYRLDFGVYKYNSSNPKIVIKKYCVECDGFDFHSSKAQIVRDNQRMKNLLLHNDYTTIRYLGTEIHNLTKEDIGMLMFNL